MPYDDKGRFWAEKRDGVYSNGVMCYSPPPQEDDNPPPPYGEEEECGNAV